MSEIREQARAKLRELIEAAESGRIIPVRLPGQLQEIEQLLAKAQKDEDAAAANAPAATGEVGEVIQENARFISVAVHELRTPMTSIRGYADMMGSGAMGELSDIQNQFIGTIRTNAKRMEGLLTDVSDMSKIQGSTLKINKKMDMFKNIAMMVEKNTRATAEELNRELIFDIPQGLPLLTTDGEMLAKAFTKLVENGLRYNDKEQGQVTLSARGEGSTLVVEVKDNGIGIKPEELPRVGEVYWRSDDERVRQHKGSGLGVPIAQGIFKLLGGKVTFASTPEEGTTATVKLDGMT